MNYILLIPNMVNIHQYKLNTKSNSLGDKEIFQLLTAITALAEHQGLAHSTHKSILSLLLYSYRASDTV